jgi:hypothetical protein
LLTLAIAQCSPDFLPYGRDLCDSTPNISKRGLWKGNMYQRSHLLNFIAEFWKAVKILLPFDLTTPDGFTAGAIALTRCDLTFTWTVLDLFSSLALGAMDDGHMQPFPPPSTS